VSKQSRSVREERALVDPEYLVHPTLAASEKVGRKLRKRTPVELLGTWRRSRRLDPIAVLRRQGNQRVQELVPLRYGRMAQSPFAFYRGGAAIMAADLSSLPSPGLRVQLCGDAHLLNFGMFETPERSLVFGLNDFDETLPGPFEWDVHRLSASMEVAGRDLGLAKGQRRKAVAATVRAYREAMQEFASMRTMDVWYARLPAAELRGRLAAAADPASGNEVERRIGKALSKDHLRAFERLVVRDGKNVCFRAQPPVLVPVEDLLDEHQAQRYPEVIGTFLREYRSSLPADRRHLVESYRFVSMARKVVGVGSVGTRVWVVLFAGRNVDDPLILQLKEAQPSVLAPYAGATRCASEGQRVVEGQRLMQAASDHLLGWYRLRAFDDHVHDFYVRQLWDGKASIEVAHLSARGLRAYGEACGWTLARGHARTGDRVAIASYLGDGPDLEEAMVGFGERYADVVERDHSRLLEAIEGGEVEAIRGV
jgi:uncharacterized protein (DUF2252 family)